VLQLDPVEGRHSLVIGMIQRDRDALPAGLGEEPGGLGDSAAIGRIAAGLRPVT
jgi:hypothetical protein